MNSYATLNGVQLNLMSCPKFTKARAIKEQNNIVDNLQDSMDLKGRPIELQDLV